MKLNKLLPIVALSGIATVAMPLVTSCAKGVESFNLDDSSSLVKGAPMLHNKNKVSLSKNSLYVANIDMAKWQSDLYDKWTLEIVKDLESEPKFGFFSKVNMWVDEVKFTQAEAPSSMLDNQFVIINSETESTSMLAFKTSTMEKTSKIKIEFELSNDINDCYMIFFNTH